MVDFTFYTITKGWSEEDSLLILRTLLVGKRFLIRDKQPGEKIYIKGKGEFVIEGQPTKDRVNEIVVKSIDLRESADPDVSSLTVDYIIITDNILFDSGLLGCGFDDDLIIWQPL